MLSIDPQEYHLGDSVVPGWPPAAGRTWSRSFELPATPGTTTLLIDVQETQAEHNEVTVNGQNIGHLLHNPKREYAVSRHQLAPGILRNGTNTVSISVGLLAEHPQQNYDDILIRNIRLDLAVDPIAGFCQKLAARLESKKYRKLLVTAPVDLAYVKTDVFGGRYVVGVVDARRSGESPAAIFERVKSWFQAEVGGREHGVLLLVYSPALASVVKQIEKTTFYAGSIAVFPGAYDLSTDEHWLSARGLEYDLFDKA